MAAEVLVLRIVRLREYEQYELLVFYRIDPVITTMTEPPVVVVPSPSDTLPDVCNDYDLVPQVYRNQLDAGMLMFEVVPVDKHDGQTEQDLLQRVREKYLARAGFVVGDERRKYSRLGTWVDM